MIDKVAVLMREVAAQAVLPRYQRLVASEIREKAPGDLVTVADSDAERLLAARLVELIPGSAVVGEEAVYSDPSLMSHIARDATVWLVDPVDGTGNFAGGREPFAMMVALLRAGRTEAAWILHPVSGTMATAQLGGGAFLDGRPIMTSGTRRPANRLRGAAPMRYVPAHLRAELVAAAPTIGELLPGTNCAGYEYPAIARDEQQFVLFWRMLPWDHAPGVLFIEEAGGVAWHLDGTSYDPAAPRVGVLVAQNAETWHTVRTTLLAHVPA